MGRNVWYRVPSMNYNDDTFEDYFWNFLVYNKQEEHVKPVVDWTKIESYRPDLKPS